MTQILYGRIGYQVSVDGYVVQIMSDIHVGSIGPYQSLQNAELAFHVFYPDGYIIPDWVGF